MYRHLIILLVVITSLSCKKRAYRYYFQEATIQLQELNHGIKFDHDTIVFGRQYNVVTLHPYPYIVQSSHPWITDAYASYRHDYIADDSLVDFKIITLYDYNDSIASGTDLSEWVSYHGIEYVDQMGTTDTFNKQEIIHRFNAVTKTISDHLVYGIGLRFRLPTAPSPYRPIHLQVEATTSSGKQFREYSFIKWYK